MLEMIRSGESDSMTLGQARVRCTVQLGEKLAADPTSAELVTTATPSSEAGVPPETALAEPPPPESAPADSMLGQRIKEEKALSCSPFSLIAHRENYILPVSYNNNRNGEPFGISDSRLDNVEVKFQFSLKFAVWRNVIGDADLWAAYTNLSFWQAYNSSHSSPFRDSNHEPELFLSKGNDLKFLGIANTMNRIGVVHQSNGQGGSESRSWNRVYLQMVFERDNLTVAFKPWYRIPESSKDNPGDSSGDDNPDIHAYMGYGEIKALYKWNEHTLSLLLRNNLRSSDNKGAVELGWIFPITGCINGYLQYFNGYGESLIDYNSSVNRIGIGFTFTELL
ncbi:MAG: phospholipase A [Desulfuromonadaceae bacterium]|nr:phospholipase A [Desulfuromonadaceae bacterium]